MNDLWRFWKFCFFIQGDQQHRLLFILFPFNIRSPDTCLLHVDLLSKFSLAGQGSGLHYTLFYWNSYIGTLLTIRGKCGWLLPTLNKGFGVTSWYYSLNLRIRLICTMTQWYLTSNNSSPTTLYIGKHLENSANLQTYRLPVIKQFSTDNYVLMDLQNNIRTTVMQFRDTPLCVETGHFCGVLLNEKIDLHLLYLFKKLRLMNTFF